MGVFVGRARELGVLPAAPANESFLARLCICGKPTASA
jgi:hypothetical protein